MLIAQAKDAPVNTWHIQVGQQGQHPNAAVGARCRFEDQGERPAANSPDATR